MAPESYRRRVDRRVVGDAARRRPPLRTPVKFSRYAEGGAAHYWIVDPAVPSAEIYDLRENGYLLAASGTREDTVSVAARFPVTVTPSTLVQL